MHNLKEPTGYIYPRKKIPNDSPIWIIIGIIIFILIFALITYMGTKGHDNFVKDYCMNNPNDTWYCGCGVENPEGQCAKMLDNKLIE